MDSSVLPFNPLDWPGCLELPHKYRGLAWKEHIPFAMSLVQMVKPRVLVELGVHMGDSYLAFCQAIAALKTDTKAYGVDTWQGDAHAGFYDNSIFEELSAYHGPKYSSFSQLIRSTFDEAVKEFGDGSIDLLHIDGFHSYEVVKHDWETWQPKMSSRGVVLFHDTNVHERNFGVWRFWNELKANHPHFEFSHGHGLGVLAYGKEVPEAFSRLLALKEDERVLVMRFYSRLGHYLTLDRELAARGTTPETTEVIRQLKEAIAKLTSEHGAAITVLSSERAAVNAVQQETIARLSSEHGAIIKTLSADLGALNAAHQDAIAKLTSEHTVAIKALSSELSSEHAAGIKALTAELGALNAAHQEAVAKLRSEYAATITGQQEAIAKLSSEHGVAMTALSAEKGAAHAAYQETLAKLNAEHEASIKALHAEQGALTAAHQEATAKLSSEHSAALNALRIELNAQRAEFSLKAEENKILTASLNARLAEQGERLARVSARARWMDRCEALRLRGYQAPSESLRVLFVSERNDVSHLYRVQHAVEQLQAEGGYARSVSLAQCRTEWLESFNVVVFFCQPYNARVQKLLEAAKRNNVATVFECEVGTQMTQDLEKTGRACEWFLGGTPQLVNQAGKMGIPGLLHRDALSESQIRLGNWLNKLRRIHASEPLLGCFSDADTHTEDFRNVEEVLASVFERHKNAKLIFLSPLKNAQLPCRFPGRVLHVPYELKWDEYPAVIARCHAMLLPVNQTAPLTDCRSARRFLEAGILGVPVIASPIEELRRVIVDGQNGWLASNPADWAGNICAALETASSLKVGQAARESVCAVRELQAPQGSLSALLRGIVRNDTHSPADAPEIALPSEPRETLRQKLKYIKRLSILLYSEPKRWAAPLG